MKNHVVVCILKRNKKFLISSRPSEKIFSGYWEFPGGKVNDSELFLEALRREIMEELSIKIDLNKVFYIYSYEINQNKKKLILHFFLCLSWTGSLFPMEKQQTKWIKIEKIKRFKMLESNKKIIKKLQSPHFFFPH